MHSYTNFELNNSKFSQVTQFRENFQKIQKNWTLQSILAKFNTKGPRSIYYICVQCKDDSSNFTKVRAATDVFNKNSKSHKISDWASICMKTVTIEGAWLLECCTKFQLEISSRSQIRKSSARIHTHTHTHTHTDVSSKSFFSTS